MGGGAAPPTVVCQHEGGVQQRRPPSQRPAEEIENLMVGWSGWRWTVFFVTSLTHTHTCARRPARHGSAAICAGGAYSALGQAPGDQTPGAAARESRAAQHGNRARSHARETSFSIFVSVCTSTS